VAVVATVLIAALYVAAAALIDAFAARRVLWEVDQRLSNRLSVVASLPDPLAKTIPDDVGTDGAPVYVWRVSPAGSLLPLTDGAPRLPDTATDSASGPLSVVLPGGAAYRVTARRFRGGLLLAAQDLAGPSHIEGVLLAGELVLGPVLLLAVFGGVLVIGLRAAAPAESARRRLQELTADASHELRTPLTVIEAEIELARSGAPDPAADREALDHVARESRRLKAIVQDLLWLARFDAAPRRPAPVLLDVGAVAADAAYRFDAVAASRGITIETDAAPAPLLAPAEWLDRLVGTLVDNACRYAPDGGRVRVATGVRDGRSVLCVEDDGPGVPPDERPRLFDRFHRASEVPGGAGLGLAIADAVVRSTGGRWRVDTSALGGARFQVSWRRPARGGPDGPSPQQRATSAPSSSRSRRLSATPPP